MHLSVRIHNVYLLQNIIFTRLIQHYVIKFVSELRLVGCFTGIPVSSTNKTDRQDITEYR